jgi:intracellular sulfur oxidation DsrE/DsrF family protein
MSTKDFSEDKLNLFIDEQLDTDEMNEIREALLDDKNLRERVCQLKAVRELIGYAYSEVPPSRHLSVDKKRSNSYLGRSVAASITLLVGVVLGWSTYEYSPNATQAISAENTFQYVANHVNVEHGKRKIILHIDSSDLKVVNAALNEADHLLATYRKANTPIELDIITNKSGINILRPGMSPYIDRIKELIDNNEDVAVYACNRSIAKALKKEGVAIELMPGVTKDKSARELIPERLKKGWVYIKA